MYGLQKDLFGNIAIDFELSLNHGEAVYIINFEEIADHQNKVLYRYTCDYCGDMDGKVFKMSEYIVGSTSPLFHPWCRCCTAPYFEDMSGLGERYARDIGTGETYKVPKDMTYKQWREMQNRKPLANSDKSGIIKSITLKQEDVMHHEIFRKNK